jgi:hypothetical protein
MWQVQRVVCCRYTRYSSGRNTSGRYRGSCAAGTQGIIVTGTEGLLRQVQKVLVAGTEDVLWQVQKVFSLLCGRYTRYSSGRYTRYSYSSGRYKKYSIVAGTEGLVRQVHKVSHGRYRGCSVAGTEGFFTLVRQVYSTQGILVAGTEDLVRQVHQVF